MVPNIIMCEVGRLFVYQFIIEHNQIIEAIHFQRKLPTKGIFIIEWCPLPDPFEQEWVSDRAKVDEIRSSFFSHLSL
jgi:hypothetical protein